MARPADTPDVVRWDVLRAVRVGLMCRPRRVARELFPDEEGDVLLERIAARPEFYPARAERALLERHAEELVVHVHRGGAAPVDVVELAAVGPPSALCAVVLRALVDRQGRTTFWPVSARTPGPWGGADLTRSIEVRGSSVALLRRDVPGRDPPGRDPPGRELPGSGVRDGSRTPGALAPPDGQPTAQARSLFLVGGVALGALGEFNMLGLLRRARARCAAGSALVLGADRVKDLDIVLPAFDDGAGLVAAHNKHLLACLNREVRARFDVERFGHRVRWNGRACAVELHLESLEAQRVPLEALGAEVELRRGETIHTGSSALFDDSGLDQLLARGGWARQRTFTDERGWFCLLLCRAA